MASTTFVDGQTLIEASWLNDVNAAVYTPGTVTAADIANVPNTGSGGNIAATNVQAAINELDSEKQPLDAELTALATSTAAANKIPYFTGTTTAGTLDWNSATALANSATTISSNTVIKTAIDELVANCSSATPDLAADYFVFEDVTDTTQKKALLSTLYYGLGINQTWSSVSRTSATSYQNTTGKPILFSMAVTNAGVGAGVKIEVSSDNSTWVTVSWDTNGVTSNVSCGEAIVPNNWYYKATYNGTLSFQSELA